jgi:hypothetical protein
MGPLLGSLKDFSGSDPGGSRSAASGSGHQGGQDRACCVRCLFLLGESRGHPMQVGGLTVFAPSEGAESADVRAMFEDAVARGDVAPQFRRRARRSVTTLGQWGWDGHRHRRRPRSPRPLRRTAAPRREDRTAAIVVATTPCGIRRDCARCGLSRCNVSATFP